MQENLDWDSIDVHMDPEVEIFPEGARGRIQRQLWSLFEHPNSSIGARVIGGYQGRIQRQLWSLFEHPNSSIGARVIGG